MQQSLTRSLVFFISGCFLLTLFQPSLEFDLALYGAAVDNAHDWVKEVATEFLPSNDDHGVAVFIDRIIAS